MISPPIFPYFLILQEIRLISILIDDSILVANERMLSQKFELVVKIFVFISLTKSCLDVSNGTYVV